MACRMSAWISGSSTAMMSSYFFQPILDEFHAAGTLCQTDTAIFNGLTSSLACSTSSICSTILVNTGTGLIGSTLSFPSLTGGSAW